MKIYNPETLRFEELAELGIPQPQTRILTNAEILANATAPALIVPPVPEGFAVIPYGPLFFIVDAREGGGYSTGGSPIMFECPGTGYQFVTQMGGLIYGIADTFFETPITVVTFAGLGEIDPAQVIPANIDNSGLVFGNHLSSDYTGGGPSNYAKLVFSYIIIPLV